MIPKIIHYCWFGGGQMSYLELECIDSWSLLLPDYHIRKWDESNFDYTAFAFSREAYKYKKFAFVSDVCRLHALYEEGGIYLDTDMLVLKDLSPLLNHDIFIGEEKQGLINAAIFGANKGNVEVKMLLDGYREKVFNIENPLYIPTYLTETVNRDSVKIYLSDYFYPLPFSKRGCDFYQFITKNSYAVHLWNYSWRNEWSYLHEKKFSNSLGQFLAGIRLKGLRKTDWKFLFVFSKFWFADMFPKIYRIFKN